MNSENVYFIEDEYRRTLWKFKRPFLEIVHFWESVMIWETD